ncbi:dephospho-CoA kinase [Coccomyxa subellipsoidea C-169]|uniref:Dephospho-CoA kinase n=1 Tax=Coccomyxa subellipsoidea (strain C-169) TaxID=574566 RepID=I0Z0I3_COCSC|nr:dephospho-CoA kinase [Coccomyxa subellipsoidea C-169]EIE24152.1 dephospho-CoA kinase [Coccomyxa subellipsoidea C-169]|eukprot:XP_005648696.1 dephospho-CoA kinase [Coccomyxa subellipsoidea C-169]
MKIVGLTGGIATGKSTVTNLIRQHGIPVIDCDEIAHLVTKKGKWVYKRIVRMFGSGFLKSDGEIDRERLGELVFKDAVARRKLNRATHPAVTLELAKQLLSHLLQCHSLVMVDMPLLVETGAYLLTWPRVLVKCDPETQVRRLVERDGCSKDLAQSKVAAQMPLEQKQKWCQYIIDNSGTRQSTEAQVKDTVWGLRKGLWWKSALQTPANIAVILIFAISGLVQR